MHQSLKSSGASCEVDLQCQHSFEWWMTEKELWIWAVKCALCFLDISKAFDTEPHFSLLYKLIEIGIDSYLIRWIHSYLVGRSQCVCVDGSMSNKLSVPSDVLQGSVLGPLLFICYINDIATAFCSDSQISMFADDIASTLLQSQNKDR